MTNPCDEDRLEDHLCDEGVLPMDEQEGNKLFDITYETDWSDDIGIQIHAEIQRPNLYEAVTYLYETCHDQFRYVEIGQLKIIEIRDGGNVPVKACPECGLWEAWEGCKCGGTGQAPDKETSA